MRENGLVDGLAVVYEERNSEMEWMIMEMNVEGRRERGSG